MIIQFTDAYTSTGNKQHIVDSGINQTMVYFHCAYVKQLIMGITLKHADPLKFHTVPQILNPEIF